MLGMKKMIMMIFIIVIARVYVFDRHNDGGTGPLVLLARSFTIPSIERATTQTRHISILTENRFSRLCWLMTMKSGSQVYNQINLNKSRVVYLN